MADKRIVTVDYLNSEGLNKDYINNTFANALKGSKSGSAILIDDVSPVTHDMGVKVRGKNLLNLSNRDIITNPYSSNTDVRNFNGNQLFVGITANNYFATPNIVSYSIGETITVTANQAAYGLGYDVAVKPNTKYVFSSIITNGEIRVGLYNKDGIFSRMIGGVSAFTTNSTEFWAVIVLKPLSGNESIEASFTDIQLELGTTATDYTPYVPDLTAVKVSRCGKNLLSNDTVISESATSGNKKIWSGNLPAPCTFSQDVSQFTASKPGAALFMFKLADGTEKYLSASGSRVLISGGTLKEIYFMNWAEGTGTVKCQLEIGSLETDYEPYIGTEYTPTADGTVEGVLSLYPSTTLTTDTDGVLIDCEYNRDINKFSGAVDDVQINGASIVSDGVANIPTIGKEQYGVAKLMGDNGLFGINYNKNAGLYIVKAENSNITNRVNDSRPITSANLDYAVKAAMCDGKGAAWTVEEQSAARERIGIRNLELLSDLTVAEDIGSFSMAGLDLNRILIDIELSSLPSSGVTAQIYIQTPVNNLIYIGRIAQASDNRRIIINVEYTKPFIVVNSIFFGNPNNASSTVISSPPIYCENNIKGFATTFDVYAGSKVKVFGVK